MVPIIIPFTPNSLGRVEFNAKMMTGDRKSLGDIRFKYDSGSDFTTINCDDLDRLGYTQEYLKSCPHHSGGATLATGENKTPLQYITNVSIKFGDRELQHCRVFFALGTSLRSLFGSDILKYFNREI
ncbi:MAG: retroviral-like aspartic protease family protein, partial [Oscillospiraceae bacterium]|nr:retroviral-like aspartic protease family protein [Oscillospiraceae bacterium]